MGLTAAEKRALKGEANALKGQSFIGKSGLTEAVVQQIRRAFERMKLVKLRLPRNAEAPQQLVESILQEVPCELVEQRGRVITVFRPRP